MNGPQHYREAERIIEAANGRDAAMFTALIGVAQVHATLALAAVMAHAAIGADLASDRDVQVLADHATAWVNTIGGEQ